MELAGLIVGILGLGAAVYFGVKDIQAARRKILNRRQIAKGGSTVIESGRDTKIGPQ